MTAEPQTGYPAAQPGGQQTPPGPGTGFSGYAGDAPSGLSFAAPSHAEQTQLQEYAPPPQDAYPAPAPQAAYPDLGLSLHPDELPGYLKPYPPPGGFSGQGPRVAPVVVFTLLFGVFGLISASRRAKRAEAAGDSPGRYWAAFGVTLSIGWVVGSIASILLLATGGFFAAATSADSGAPVRTITAADLSHSMVDQGTLTGKGGKLVHIKAATCTVTAVDANGAGDYKCAVTLTDATKATLRVHADAAGWHILGQAK